MADLLDDAQRRYREAVEAMQEQRRQVEEDVRFSDPTNPDQWDEKERRQRENDPGGVRPCLVMDQTQQYIANVAGQVEQRPPSLHAIPAGDGADKKVAEQLDGFYRHIEHTSRAAQHYTRALTSAARVGVGYLIVQPEYTDRALNWQEPRIGSEGDPLSVVFDPWSVELDGSDANMATQVTPFSHTEFERQWGAKAAKVSFGDAEGSRVTDPRESVLVALDWHVENKSRNMLFALDLDSERPEDVFAVAEDDFWARKKAGRNIEAAKDSAGRQNYTDKYRCVKWARMSGAEVLSEEREFESSSIGIVPVYGYVAIVNRRLKYCGIARRAREPQRAYNYHASEIRAVMAQAPKTPWVLDVRTIRGYERLWERASVEQRAFLPYIGTDEQGNALPPPARPQLAVNLQNHIQGLLQAREDVQAALGMYAANIGKQSNAVSGVAYDAQKQQGEASTAHFPAHLSASLGQVGKIVMDMIPRLIDTRRQLRILNIDKTPGTVTVDPKQPQALQETEKGLSINPNVGRYDVRSVVGPTYSTQRQESREELREMMRANPAMTPAIAPLWAQTLDIPHADKLAEVLTAVAPDSVKAILQPDAAASTSTLMAQVEQLKQALQEAIQHAQSAQQDADEAHQALQDKSAETDVQVDEVSIKAYEARTKRMQVLAALIPPEEVQPLATQTAQGAMAQPDPAEEAAPLGEQQPLVPEPMGDVPQEPALPAAPAGPSPDVTAMLHALHVQAESIMRLADALATPKKRVPVRDKAGNILHVIETPHEEQLAQTGQQE